MCPDDFAVAHEAEVPSLVLACVQLPKMGDNVPVGKAHFGSENTNQYRQKCCLLIQYCLANAWFRAPMQWSNVLPATAQRVEFTVSSSSLTLLTNQSAVILSTCWSSYPITFKSEFLQCSDSLFLSWELSYKVQVLSQSKTKIDPATRHKSLLWQMQNNSNHLQICRNKLQHQQQAKLKCICILQTKTLTESCFHQILRNIV